MQANGEQDERTFGQIGFDAYGDAGSRPWQTFDGRPMPRWNDLTSPAGAETKRRWEVAAKAIVEAYVGDKSTPAAVESWSAKSPACPGGCGCAEDLCACPRPEPKDKRLHALHYGPEAATLVQRLCGPGDVPLDIVTMAEYLAACAVDITHECGTPEATHEAYWGTVSDAVRHFAAATGPHVGLRPALGVLSGLSSRIDGKHFRIVLGEGDRLVVEFVTGNRVPRFIFDGADLDKPVEQIVGEVLAIHEAHKNDPPPPPLAAPADSPIRSGVERALAMLRAGDQGGAEAVLDDLGKILRGETRTG